MDFTYNVPWLKEIRRKLRRDSTKAERILWRELRDRHLKVKFRRQYSIGNFVADFCCPELRIVIEVDGSSHDDPRVQELDVVKQKYFESLDYTVLRFTNEEVYKHAGGVIDVIADTVQGTQS